RGSGCVLSPASCSRGHGGRGAVRGAGPGVAGAGDRRLLVAMVQAVRRDRATPGGAGRRVGRARPTRAGERRRGGGAVRALRSALPPDGHPLLEGRREGDGIRRTAARSLRAGVYAAPVSAVAASWLDILEGARVASPGVRPG